MPALILSGLFTLYSLFFPLTALANNKVSIVGIPDWVIPYSLPELNNDFVSQPNGEQYLLVDYQTLVKDNSVERYYHIALKVNDLSAIEDNSNLLFNFNPDYEHLSIHTLVTLRNGKRRLQLNQEKIRLLDRETELEYQIINGTKSASLILNDVRVGDIIEYSYTIKGVNPAFQNFYFSQQAVEWSVPVYSFKMRLLHSQNRKINIRYHKTDLKPKLIKKNNTIEYRWERMNIPALHNEGQLPTDFVLYPWIQFSEANTWEHIVQWAMPFYQPPKQTGAEFQAIIQKIKNQHPNLEQRLLATLQFTQAQIRYLGIEIGTGSFVPNPPSVVLQRRFGDCKDKTLLMISLLKGLGIEAYPALVNTQWRSNIAQWSPSATAFDHVLVYVKLNNKNYWLDPTRKPQKGSLETISQADFSWALLIKPKSQSLQAMPATIDSKKSIVDEWHFDEANDSASYKITTHYRGHWADNMRYKLASTTLEEVQKSYINYFARFYPSIVLSKPFIVVDDNEKNELSLEETYLIPNAWQTGKGQPHKLKLSFYPIDLLDYAVKPTTLHRSMPLALNYPATIEQKTQIYLGEGWDLENKQIRLNNIGFEFKKNIHFNNGILNLDYFFRSKTDTVQTDDIQHYLAALNTLDDELGYGLWKNKATTKNTGNIAQINWTLIILFTMASFIFIGFSTWLYWHNPDRSAPSNTKINAELVGIRGWLLLPALSILAYPCLTIYSLFTDSLPLLSTPFWNSLTLASSEMYHPAWAPLLIIETMINLCLLFVSFTILLLFFQKRQTFPKIFIAFLSLRMLFLIGDHFTLMSFEHIVDQLTGNEYNQLIRNCTSSVIWIIYFKYSKRVRATFVNSRKS